MTTLKDYIPMRNFFFLYTYIPFIFLHFKEITEKITFYTFGDQATR